MLSVNFMLKKPLKMSLTVPDNKVPELCEGSLHEQTQSEVFSQMTKFWEES